MPEDILIAREDFSYGVISADRYFFVHEDFDARQQRQSCPPENSKYRYPGADFTPRNLSAFRSSKPKNSRAKFILVPAQTRKTPNARQAPSIKKRPYFFPDRAFAFGAVLAAAFAGAETFPAGLPFPDEAPAVCAAGFAFAGSPEAGASSSAP
jgi:hypothetical protein